MNVASSDRLYGTAERVADAVIHVAGVLFAINGGLWLLSHVTRVSALVSVSVYCGGLFVMLAGSALYNLWPPGNTKEWLRRFDHAAIFIMIAATYTPFAVNRLGPQSGPIILTLVWFGATAGVAMKILFPRRFEVASICLYIGLGWLMVTVIRSLAADVAAANFRLLIAGGLVYTAGVVFYLVEKLPYHKAIWHSFVLAAVIMHFAAVAGEFAV